MSRAPTWGCDGLRSQAGESSSRRLVEDFIAAFSRGDAKTAFAMMANTGTWWVAGTVEGLSGSKDRDTFRAMLERVAELTTAGAIELRPTGWTVDGGRIAVEVRAHATLLDGRVYDNRYHFVFEVASGLINEVRAYLDTEHLRSVFGKL